MRVSKRTLVRRFGTVQPYIRGSSHCNGNEDSALDDAEGGRRCIRGLRRDADRIGQDASGHPARRSRKMKGVQPFACI